jgi:hypothetical protein
MIIYLKKHRLKRKMSQQIKLSGKKVKKNVLLNPMFQDYKKKD